MFQEHIAACTYTPVKCEACGKEVPQNQVIIKK